MNSDSNQAPGLGLPPPSTGQGPVPAAAVQPQAMPSEPALPQDASDEANDAIDQDWVNKAKDIVERTKNDPFAESNELNRIKAEYLKARYNKQLNVGEDRPK